MREMIPLLISTLSIINYAFIFILILDKKSPSRTLSWLLVLIFMPTIGFILYLFLGINWGKRKIIYHLNKIQYKLPDHQALQTKSLDSLMDIPEAKEKIHLLNIAKATTFLPACAKNSASVFSSTNQAFHNILTDILEAKHHIHLEFYTFRNDQMGQRLITALKQKADEGLSVRLIIDAFGSHRSIRKGLLQNIDHANIEVAVFQPLKFSLLNLRTNYRNHRKIVVIDGSIGYIGGMNIGNEYLGEDNKFGYWRDTVIRIYGESVYSIQLTFLHDWQFATKKQCSFDEVYFPEIIQSEESNTLIQIVPSSPDSDSNTIAQLYFESVAAAQNSLYITTPYFIPDESLLMGLKTAALGGCDVKVIIPGKADHIFTHLATQSFLEEIILAGVEVYIYTKERFIHAKVITVDGIFASVGSANFDQRSININFEIIGLIYNKELVTSINKDFFRDLQHCTRLTLEAVRNKSIIRRTAESLTRLFSPIL
jgi:cardiolipin synthase A/B